MDTTGHFSLEDTGWSLEWDKIQPKLLKNSSWSQLQPSSRAGVQALGLFPTSWAHSGAWDQQWLLWHPSCSIFASIIDDAKGCRELPAPCPCASRSHCRQPAWFCDAKSAWEGLEGPSARLREGPGIEILESSQDGSLKATSRRACLALKALFVLQLWLKESSSQRAAGGDEGQTH